MINENNKTCNTRVHLCSSTAINKLPQKGYKYDTESACTRERSNKLSNGVIHVYQDTDLMAHQNCFVNIVLNSCLISQLCWRSATLTKFNVPALCRSFFFFVKFHNLRREK